MTVFVSVLTQVLFNKNSFFLRGMCVASGGNSYSFSAFHSKCCLLRAIKTPFN